MRSTSALPSFVGAVAGKRIVTKLMVDANAGIKRSGSVTGALVHLLQTLDTNMTRYDFLRRVRRIVYLDACLQNKFEQSMPSWAWRMFGACAIIIVLALLLEYFVVRRRTTGSFHDKSTAKHATVWQACARAARWRATARP